MVTRALAGLLCLGLLWPTFAAAQIGSIRVVDGVAAGQADVQTSDPAGTEEGLVVRNIPSGVQHGITDSGSVVTLLQGGNQAAVSASGRLQVEAVIESSGGTEITASAVDTDDASVATDQTSVSLVIGMNRLYDGTSAWIRRIQSANSLNSTGAGLAPAQLVGQCDDAAPTALTENSFGNARVNCTTHEILVSASPTLAAAWGVYVEDLGETASGNLMMAGSVRRDVAASSAGTTGDNATLNTDANGLLWTRNADPCSSLTKTAYVVNIATATTTEIVNADASNKFYICSINVVAAAAQAVAVVEDDTDTCGSPTLGLNGGVTAATGWSFAANGGISLGNGTGTVMKTSAVNRYLCLMTSTTGQLSGTIMYATAP